MKARPFALALLALTTISLAGPLAVYTRNTSLKVSEPDGTVLLELAPFMWGPNWGYVGLKGEFAEGDGQSAGRFNGTVKGSNAQCTFEVALRSDGPRSLRMDVAFAADRDTELTQAIVSLKAGRPLQGKGRVTAADAAGEKPLDLPFGRGLISNELKQLAFLVDEGRSIGVAFDPPAMVNTDGEARIVLAAGRIAAGERRTVSIRLSLPADASFALSPANVPLPANAASWFEWKADADTSKPSAIDASGWLEKPAGQRGRIVRDGDRLLYDGKPIKLWGINVNYAACAPAKDVAARQARFYAKYGLNAVRLHKYADGSGWQGILSNRSFVEFDPAKLEQMDYYVHQLKEQGIFVEFSPIFGAVRVGPDDAARVPFANELDASRDGWRNATQGMTWFSDELQDLAIEQTTKLLQHRNPHTGLRYADDPAVAFVELVNENSALFFFTLAAMQKSPTIQQRAGEAFFQWLKDKYGTEKALLDAWGNSAINVFANERMLGEGWDKGLIYPVGNPWFFDPEQLEGAMKSRKQRLLDTIAFLHHQQNRFYDRFVKAIRDTGYTGEIVASNWQAGRAFSHFANLHSDSLVGTIDRHNYFSGTGSMLSRPGSGMLSTGLQQVADRPFMLSEWIHEFPNEFGAEGPAILAAYGMGLNDWDVSFIFHNRDDGRFRNQLGERWDVVAPQLFAAFPAVARMVLRGDVQPAEPRFVRNVHLPSLFQGKLGFDDRVQQGYDVKEFGSESQPAAVLAVGRAVVRFTDQFVPTPAVQLGEFIRDGVFRSMTGQLAWTPGTNNHDGHITINTPGTQALVGFAENVTADLENVKITSRSPFAAIYVTALSRDRTLADDSRLLVTTIGRVRNTGMKVVAGEVVVRGGPPMIVEPIVVDLQLKRSGKPVVHILDHDGRRTGRTLDVANGKVTLDGAQTMTVYYEIEFP